MDQRKRARTGTWRWLEIMGSNHAVMAECMRHSTRYLVALRNVLAQLPIGTSLVGLPGRRSGRSHDPCGGDAAGARPGVNWCGFVSSPSSPEVPPRPRSFAEEASDFAWLPASAIEQLVSTVSLNTGSQPNGFDQAVPLACHHIVISSLFCQKP